MLNKQNILDFISDKEVADSNSSQLFLFSQEISENEYFALTKKFLNSNDFSFYWSNPSEYFSFLAYGEVYSICKKEVSDLSNLGEQINNLPFNIVSNNQNYIGIADPLFVGGIKFPSAKVEDIWNDFEFAKWSIPEILLLRSGNNFKVIIHSFKKNIDRVLQIIESPEYAIPENNERDIKVLSIEPNTGIGEWSDSVASALEKISRSKLQKVVLSRFNLLELNTAPNILRQIQKLEINFNNCVTFAYKSKNSIFFGSTPEKLFSVKDGLIEADALAGSAPRGIKEAEDKAIKKFLLSDQKNLAEHKSVVDFILQQLTPFTEKILFDSQPTIKEYSNIQHLYSQVRAILQSDISFFTILEKLFPTPAVCGFPSNEALETINELEIFDRGLFSGAIGWFNLNGSAEFSVGIRSALLRNNLLQAYAGCGIVNGSDPLSEFNETELKLKPILNLFNNETLYKS